MAQTAAQKFVGFAGEIAPRWGVESGAPSPPPERRRFGRHRGGGRSRVHRENRAHQTADNGPTKRMDQVQGAGADAKGFSECRDADVSVPSLNCGGLEAALSVLTHMKAQTPTEVGNGQKEAAATTELLLEALAPRPGDEPPSVSWAVRPAWPEMESRPATKNVGGFFSAEAFLGQWVDSAGSMISVCATDAFDIRLMATLCRPSRSDIQLHLRPVAFGGGWRCGHSMLDPYWSSWSQMHWVTADGSLTVWVRLGNTSARDSEAQEAEAQRLAHDEAIAEHRQVVQNHQGMTRMKAEHML